VEKVTKFHLAPREINNCQHCKYETDNTESTIYNAPNNALVCNKILIQMSHTKTLQITPTGLDHQIIIRELFDPD
jgi:hypothetical protein